MEKNSGMGHPAASDAGNVFSAQTQYPIEWSKRALIIGIALAVLECLIAPYNDYVIRNTFLAGGHFPLAPFFVLSVLALVVNSVLRFLHPKLALSSQELIVIWCIMIAVAGIPSSGMMRDALSAFAAYSYFATPENEWRSLFFQYIPEWRVVRDEGAIVSFYEGLSVGENIPWGAWLKPLSVWALYVLTAYFVMICLAVVLRKQWVEYEKCTFPLVQLPVEISVHRSGIVNSFFKSRKMWVGFAIPAFIHTLNGLHAYFPTLPQIPIRFWLDPFLVGRPLNALRPFQIVVLMSMVGFSYLLTLEVAFSLWFFFLFFKLQCLIGSMLGFLITKGPGVKWTAYSFSAAQEAGACLTLAGFALFKARRHIKQLFLSGFGRSSPQSDAQNEPMPAGLTVLGLIGGLSLLIYLNVLMGMSLGFAVLFVIFSSGVFIALTWQIINGGIPFINPSFSPQSFFLTTLGSAHMTSSTTTWLFMQPTGLTSHLREFMMPNVMNGLKAADAVRANRRRLLIAMGVAMVLGLLVSYYSVLKVSYQHGALYVHTGGSGGARSLSAILTSPPRGTDWTNTGFTLFGSVFTIGLMWMRKVFVWWPIHPIGYTMLSSWASFKLWFSILLGYLLKYGTVKYGGLRAYREARPLFLGLILGEMTCAGVWSIVGMITGIETGYRILLD